MATPARRYKQFLDSLEPPMRRAFERSIDRIIARASIGELTDAINDQAVISAMRMLIEMPWMAEEIAASAVLDNVMTAAGVTDAAFAEMHEAIREAFKAAGAFYMAAEVPSRFGMNFRMTTPRVNEWLDQRSSQLITGDLIPEQRRAVQIALSNGVGAGRNPRDVALDIVGRINNTGRRAGGIIGLTSQQADAVAFYGTRKGVTGWFGMKGDLINLRPSYFTRKLRDHRYDAMVRRAIDSGTPLTNKQIETITGRYADRLLKLRGDTIARTESIAAANGAGQEAMEQVIDEGLAERGAVQKQWDSTRDGRARPAHWAANGKRVNIDAPFNIGGEMLMYPGDSNGSAWNVINCRCFVQHVIDFSRTRL